MLLFNLPHEVCKRKMMAIICPMAEAQWVRGMGRFLQWCQKLFCIIVFEELCNVNKFLMSLKERSISWNVRKQSKHLSPGLKWSAERYGWRLVRRSHSRSKVRWSSTRFWWSRIQIRLNYPRIMPADTLKSLRKKNDNLQAQLEKLQSEFTSLESSFADRETNLEWE